MVCDDTYTVVCVVTAQGWVCVMTAQGWVWGHEEEVQLLSSLLQMSPCPSRHQVEDAFDGNICRCTGEGQRNPTGEEVGSLHSSPCYRLPPHPGRDEIILWSIRH